jgi:predicted Zn-dependent peptidase
MFRVGRVDEELPWSGITHLVEHLTLFELGMNPTYTYNGAVTPARTYFVTSGTADDIAAYFAHVTSRLHALPLQRLEAEKTVLLAEASSRPTTPGDLLFGLRYGSRGHGLYLYDELALRQVSGDNVQSWADHWFTRENAVLFVSGEPPPNLRLNLPPGVRRPEPKPEELHLTLPAYAQRRVGGAGAGMVGARSSELLLASNIVARRALESLRYKQGIAYHVASNYLPTGPDRAHVTFWTDCEQTQAGAVLTGLVASVYDVATVGPTEVELKAEVEQFRKSIERDEAALPWLDRTAVRILSASARSIPPSCSRNSKGLPRPRREPPSPRPPGRGSGLAPQRCRRQPVSSPTGHRSSLASRDRACSTSGARSGSCRQAWCWRRRASRST